MFEAKNTATLLFAWKSHADFEKPGVAAWIGALGAASAPLLVDTNGNCESNLRQGRSKQQEGDPAQNQARENKAQKKTLVYPWILATTFFRAALPDLQGLKPNHMTASQHRPFGVGSCHLGGRPSDFGPWHGTKGHVGVMCLFCVASFGIFIQCRKGAANLPTGK